MFTLLIVVVGRTGFTDTAWGVSTQVAYYGTRAEADTAYEKMTQEPASPHYSLDVRRLYS